MSLCDALFVIEPVGEEGQLSFVLERQPACGVATLLECARVEEHSDTASRDAQQQVLLPNSLGLGIVPVSDQNDLPCCGGRRLQRCHAHAAGLQPLLHASVHLPDGHLNRRDGGWFAQMKGQASARGCAAAFERDGERVLSRGSGKRYIA